MSFRSMGAADRRTGAVVVSVLSTVVLTLSACQAPSGPQAAQETPAPQETAEQRLAALGLVLPEPSAPVANYVRAVTSGNLVFLAGHIPRREDGTVVRGRLGETLTVEQGARAARRSAIALLASLRAEIGSLDRVVRIVKVTGMVNSAPEFDQQSAVINGCSDLLVQVFGEAGRHARAAVGMAALPLGAAVEIEMIVEI